MTEERATAESLYAIQRRIEEVQGKVAAALFQVSRDPKVLSRVDPQILVRNGQGLVDLLEEALELIDVVRFGPASLKQGEQLPME